LLEKVPGWKEKMNRSFPLIITAIVILIIFSPVSRAADVQIPFLPGEKLTLHVRWAFIPAGEVQLEILPFEVVNGVKSYHFAMTARTSPLVDPFYKVRDRVDAYTDTEMTHSLLYKKQQQGKSKRNVVVNFDWKKREAQYSNFDEHREPVSISAGSFDPLSVFYAFRLFELKEGVKIKAPVTDGKKFVNGEATVLKKEKIYVADEWFETYLVVPDLKHIGGIFKKSKDAKLRIWVTADKRRMPIKIKSKVAVGSFVAELVSYEQGKPVP
jgi:hypothetical protein